MINNHSSGPSDNSSLWNEKSQTVFPIVRQLPRRVTNHEPRKEENYNNPSKNLHKGFSLLWNTSNISSVEGIFLHVNHYESFCFCKIWLFCLFENIFTSWNKFSDAFHHSAVLPTPITRIHGHHTKRPKHEYISNIPDFRPFSLSNFPLLTVSDITNGRKIHTDLLILNNFFK